ncbi:YhcN/YlaJ family sporulation lipoprotein [Paenibacillus sp. J2TS4]|uniref:YhcN/YlaJ family sporulation lipoprotein n=1 Tax=Paenibacillus sp. J2TS4 TaxID=2807194 RepID=UPI001B24C6DC|nr:YhcN/YlaJ family sporulation lipoprotein [Paenibacillus sp. J2TS4]GIP31307.1 lipoprotein YhcN [Paenibacillus sp. J2TS4]
MSSYPLKKVTLTVVLVSIAAVLTLTGCGAETKRGAAPINKRGLDQANPYGMNRVGDGTVPHATGTPYHTNDRVMERSRINASSKMEMSQHVADAVAALDEVDSANVLVTDNNAYVAVKLHSGSAVQNTNPANPSVIGDVTPEIKQKIADKVKSVDAHIKEVYVSANPDFVERMNVYAQDFREGRPLSGFVKEFSAIVERIFPTRVISEQSVVTP